MANASNRLKTLRAVFGEKDPIGAAARHFGVKEDSVRNNWLNRAGRDWPRRVKLELEKMGGGNASA